MGLLFGGKPEEVPFRRKILRSLVYAEITPSPTRRVRLTD